MGGAPSGPPPAGSSLPVAQEQLGESQSTEPLATDGIAVEGHATEPMPVSGPSSLQARVVDAPQASISDLSIKRSRGIACRRRVVRSCLLVASTSVFVLAWLMLSFPYSMFVESHSYDAAAGLFIQTSACDVTFATGSDARVTYEVMNSAIDVTLERSSGDQTLLSGIYAGNKNGCEHTPRRSCASACMLTITVPPAAAAATFILRQVRARTRRRVFNTPSHASTHPAPRLR